MLLRSRCCEHAKTRHATLAATVRTKTANIPESAADADESHLLGDREDKLEESPVAPEQFSAYLENGFFKVPRVIDQGN